MKQYIQQRLSDIAVKKQPVGYRRTKLGVIPETWKTPELNAVLTENKDRNRDSRFSKEDVLSVSGEVGVTNQIELLGRSFAGESVLDYHVVEHGDIVYTKSPLKANPYGIIKQNKNEAGIVSTLYAVYHPCDYNTGTYLDYYFELDRSVNNYLRPLVRKGTKNSMEINNEDALKGQIILPPPDERVRILEILECCDKVIRLKRELLAEKKKQKKSLMQKLLNPDSGFRLPGFEGEWQKRLLEECGKFVKGYGITNSDCCAAGKPCIKYGDIYMYYDTVIKNAVSFIPQALFEKSTRISSGKLLFTCSGEDSLEIGKCVAYIGEETVAIGGDIIVMTPEKVDCLFLSYQQNSWPLIRQKAALGKGNSIVHIHLDEIKKLQVDLPPTLEEQQAIAKLLTAADREIDLLEQDLTQWEQKKKSLMQLLLTGKVRVLYDN